MIGEFKTSVRGMAIRTIGLGGDSEIDLADWPRVRIGPRRVIPLCRLHEDFPDLPSRLDAVTKQLIPREANVLDIVALPEGIEPGDNRLLQTLANAPLFLIEVAAALNRPGPAYLPWRELEGQGRLRRYGLTLTDILHVEGRFTAFDRETSVRFLNFWGLLVDADPDAIVAAIHREFRRLVIDEILATELPEGCPWNEMDRESGLRHWLADHLAAATPAGASTQFRTALAHPVIPVGAPTHALFPQLQPILQQDILLSEHAGVANAFGAIAGDVVLRETAVVRVTESGTFLCSWKGENVRATNLKEALDFCERGLRARLEEAAEANAVPYREPIFQATSHEAETRDGMVFLGVTLNAELRG